MHIPLGKGNLDFRFPETPVNLLVKVAYDREPVISILYPDAKLKVKRALPEIHKQHLGGRKAATLSWPLAQAARVSITRGTSDP